MKLPKRSKKYGVGKEIGGCVYVHRNYAHVLPQEEFGHVIKDVPSLCNKEYTLIKYNPKRGAFTFIWCDDFDTAHEPTMGDALLIYPDPKHPDYLIYKYIWALDDPWIYHHKWLMVNDDYTGFNVEASKARSEIWLSFPDIDKSRIGKKSYWDKNVVPMLAL